MMMLLSTGGMLMEESETGRPVKEKQEEEGESVEIFVRHSKPRKVSFSAAITFPVVIPSPCCYQYQSVIQGHQIEHGLVAPLLC